MTIQRELCIIFAVNSVVSCDLCRRFIKCLAANLSIRMWFCDQNPRSLRLNMEIRNANWNDLSVSEGMHIRTKDSF